MRVKAMAVMERGGPLVPYAYETAPLGPFDVLLEVRACGLCHSDIHMADDDWGITRFPLVPGHEVVGVVRERGREVTHLSEGDRVGVGWQRSSCLRCSDCLSGRENLCSDNRGLIVGGHGGFARHLVTDSRFCFPLPPDLPDEAAGPLLCGGVTVYSALRHAGMTSGQEVGVVGLGGLGHLAVQFASRLGNRVTVFTTSEDKVPFASSLGAFRTVVVREGERPRTERPLDLLLQTVPQDPGLALYLDLLGSDGTLVFVGVPLQPIPLPVGSLLSKRRRIMASPIGGRAEVSETLDVAHRFGVRPLVETYPLSEAEKAFQRLRENRVRYRAVLLPGG